MARRVLTVAVSLILASCTASAGEVDVAPPSNPDATVFCNIWFNGRDALISSWNDDGGYRDHNWATRIEGEIAGYDRLVPAEIRGEWDRAKVVFDDIADLRFTVGYLDENIRPEHLEMVFGEAGPDPAIADAEAAIDAIDAWSATSCGDFCSRWDSLVEVVHFEPEPRADFVNQAREDFTRWEGWAKVGDQLVPDAIAAEWQTARQIKAKYYEMLQSRGFELDYDDADTETAKFTEFMGRTPEAARHSVDTAFEAIEQWRARNCEQAAQTTTGSGPGRLTVALQPDAAIAHTWIVLALLPAGKDFSSVRSIVDYAAGSCQPLQGFEEFEGFAEFGTETNLSVDEVAEVVERLESGESFEDIAADFGMDAGEFVSQWQFDRIGIDMDGLVDLLGSGMSFEDALAEMSLDPVGTILEMEAARGEAMTAGGWENMTLRPINDDTEYSDDVCQFQEQEAILNPGDHELFVGSYFTYPGDWRFFVAAPQACAQIPVTIGGDTTIEMPELGPCPVGAVGDDQEIARRSSSTGGDASLRLRLEQPYTSESRYGCYLRMALLPAGTTLNEVGRGEVWPAGGTALGIPPEAQIEGVSVQPGSVPILAYPTTSGLRDLNFNFREDGTWDASFPDPVALENGKYDLWLQQACLQQQDDDEDAVRSCAMVSVDVRGETIVDMPEFGECP
ncbi:MAG: hypothetical protein QNL12_08950 [Acidimicrobiia bacterium]|nr:hypothetical protein [Acidimicrobiia bacterium]